MNRRLLLVHVRRCVFTMALIAAAGCARSAGPLPGDSVSIDGGVTLSPPRLSTSPTEAREATEGLGPVESRLYPPELVMEHQGEIAITPEQKKAIINETERGQSEMVRLQWELQGEKEKLVKLLDGDHLDEQKVQDIARGVMDKESKVKSSHLGMLVRVKNILTSEQITKLREIRRGAIEKAPPAAPLPTMSVRSAPPAAPPNTPTTAAPSLHKPAPRLSPPPKSSSPSGPEIF